MPIFIDGKEYEDEASHALGIPTEPKAEGERVGQEAAQSSPVTRPRVYIPTSENNAPEGSVEPSRGIPEVDARSAFQKLTGQFGERYQTWPEKAIRAAGEALLLPGKVASGEVQSGSVQEIEKAFDLAGIMVAGPAPVARKMADGTLGSFAGVRSQGLRDPALRAKLHEAQDMELAAAHPDDIWMQTGFFKGADSRWRYEISDKNMKLKDEAFDTIITPGKPAPNPRGWFSSGGTPDVTTVAIKSNLGKWLRLPDVIDHPELFKAYPELQKTYVQPLPPTSKSLGMYEPDSNVLFLKDGLDPAYARSVIAHEVQHAIQKIENFARGGSTSEFLPAELGKAKIMYNIAKEDAYNAIQTALGLKPKEIDQLVKAVELKEAGKGLPDWEEHLAKLKKAGAYNSLANIAKSERLLKEAQEQAALKYRRLAGEVEARNVQMRLNISDKELKYDAPTRTEDTPRFLQQVLGQTEAAPIP